MEPGRRGSPVNAMVQKEIIKVFAMTEDSGKKDGHTMICCKGGHIYAAISMN